MEKIATGAAKSEEMTLEVGSGNVYADLGYSDPEEMAAKAGLVRQIRATMQGRGLSQTSAAKIMGIDQPTLSKLLRGVVRNVTIDRLSLMLRRLGRNIIIVVEPSVYSASSEAAMKLGQAMIGHVEVRDGAKAILG